MPLGSIIGFKFSDKGTWPEGHVRYHEAIFHHSVLLLRVSLHSTLETLRIESSGLKKRLIFVGFQTLFCSLN